MLPGRWSFKCKRKPDWKISKFKAGYCIRGDVQNRLSPKPLNLYSTMVQWGKVRLMLTLQCILVFQSQSIDFTNYFSQAYIQGREPVFIELLRYFKSDRGKCDVVIRLNKSLYGQEKSACLWYERLRNNLLDSVFVMSKVDP